ncbi:hypothetical protein D3C71_842980 [compost metagenome]
MLQLALKHQVLHLDQCRCEEHGALRDLDQRQAFLDQLAREVHGQGRIECDLLHVKSTAVRAHVVCHAVEVGECTVCDHHVSLPGPACQVGVSAFLHGQLVQVQTCAYVPDGDGLVHAIGAGPQHFGLPCERERCKVFLLRKVQAHVHPGAVRDGRDAQLRLRALLPGPHVHPRAFPADPHIQALGQEVGQRAGHGHGFAGLRLQLIELDRLAQVGVGLDPHRRVEVVITIVQRVDDAEHPFVLDNPVQDLGDVRAPFVADAAAVGARRGDSPQQRLLTRAARAVDHVIHRPRLVRMQLIEQREVHVQAVQRAAFSGQRRGLAAGVGHRQAVLHDGHAQVGAQAGRALGHGLGIIEHDARLVAGGGRRVALGTVLTVSGQHVEQQAGALGALSVLAGFFLVGLQESAQPCFTVHPPEDGGEDEALPGLHLELAPFSRPLALDMGQQLNEGARARCPLGIEHPGPVFTGLARQVIHLALHSQADPFAGGDRAAENIAHVLMRALDVFVHRCGLVNMAKPCGFVSGLGSMPGSVGCT